MNRPSTKFVHILIVQTLRTMSTPAALQTIDASSEDLDKIFEAIVKDGGVIVANLLPPALLEELMASIEPHFQGRKLYDSKSADEELGDDFFPAGSQRVYGLLGKIPDTISQIMRLTLWQKIMERFLW